MNKYISHRWQYDPTMKVYKCVPPDFSDVPNPNYCEGCGAVISLEEYVVIWANNADAVVVSLYLNTIVEWKER